MKSLQCKAVVVGSGAGGAVAAAALAEAGIDAIILEQGGAFGPSDHGDILTAMTNMYANAGFTVAVGFPPIPLPLGRAVGGTTIINSSTCFRPAPDKVAAWQGPVFEELLPFFEEVERRIHAHAVDESLLGGNWRVIKRGCDKLGISVKPLVHNLKDCKRAGRCAFGCPQGAKMSMELTFVPDAVAAGARLYTRYRVAKVVVDRGRAVKVCGHSPDGPFEVKADVIVLCMGSVGTPSFLLKSGLANSSGRVGRGLCIHPAARVAAEFEEVVDGFDGLPQGAYIDHWSDRGIMMEGVFTPPGPLAVSLPGVGHNLKSLSARYRHLSAFGVMVSDTATGRVRRPSLFTPFPVFYQFCQNDAATLHYGIARLAEIYLESGAKQVFTGFCPCPRISSIDELRRFEQMQVRPGDYEVMAFHPLGTCAMGRDPAASVVDFSLQSHDIPGLYIMDGSVIPSALGVNPQVTIMALALRAARLLAGTLDGKNGG